MNIKKYLISVILATSLIACNNTNNNTDKAKEPGIKKTYTTAEQHQIWKDEITKLVPSGYKIEFNFEKIEDMLFNAKEANLCFTESKKNFEEFFQGLKVAKNSKQANEALETFVMKYKIVNDNVCAVLKSNAAYEYCAKYSQNTMDITNASYLKDEAKIKDIQEDMTANSIACMGSLSGYNDLIQKNETPLQRKLAIFAGGDKPPFTFCESMMLRGTPKHYCRITEFQKAGLVSRFE